MANKTIVITGASAGIGAGSRGGSPPTVHTLVLAARRQSELERVADELNAPAPARSPWSPTSPAAPTCKRVADHRDRGFGGFDVWINNAGRGITRIGPRSDRRRRRRDDVGQRQVGALWNADRRGLFHSSGGRHGPDHQRVVVSRAGAAGTASFGVQRGESRAERAHGESPNGAPQDRTRTFTSRSSCRAWSRRNSRRTRSDAPPGTPVYSGPSRANRRSRSPTSSRDVIENPVAEVYTNPRRRTWRASISPTSMRSRRKAESVAVPPSGDR